MTFIKSQTPGQQRLFLLEVDWKISQSTKDLGKWGVAKAREIIKQARQDAPKQVKGGAR